MPLGNDPTFIGEAASRSPLPMLISATSSPVEALTEATSSRLSPFQSPTASAVGSAGTRTARDVVSTETFVDRYVRTAALSTSVISASVIMSPFTSARVIANGSLPTLYETGAENTPPPAPEYTCSASAF